MDWDGKGGNDGVGEKVGEYDVGEASSRYKMATKESKLKHDQPSHCGGSRGMLAAIREPPFRVFFPTKPSVSSGFMCVESGCVGNGAYTSEGAKTSRLPGC